MPLVQTRGAASAQGFGEFAQAAVAVNYIEDVFSTYLYTGTGAAQTITNNIDLSTKGGLVWIKNRSVAVDHALFDTVRGATNVLQSNSSSGQTSGYSPDYFNAFTSTGFSFGSLVDASLNTNNSTYASWTFRKQPKFFDVVTYTGNDVAGRAIPHNLGSVPGCIIVKRTSGTSDWAVYHRGIANPNLYLNLTDSNNAAAAKYIWGNDVTSISPTATEFTIGGVNAGDTINNTGSTYVAYLFAHDAGGFGLTGTDNVISCGSLTADGSGNSTVTLGYEPQWIIAKPSSEAGSWRIYDSMRGMNLTRTLFLNANTSAVEGDSNAGFIPNATGFTTNGQLTNPSATYIYIAIRRGPMKVPTLGTSVFQPVTYTGNGTSQSVTTGITGDLTYIKYRTDAGAATIFTDRLRGSSQFLESNSSVAEDTSAQHLTSFNQLGFSVGNNGNVNASSGTFISETFKRAPSFFDEVCYTGTGANQTISHNLGVIPELIISKGRSNSGDWFTYVKLLDISSDGNGQLRLNTNGTASAFTMLTSPPTSTNFIASGGSSININTRTYVAYLFATCPGVSKVGSYTGNGTTQTINCGFTGGARFVLIKRTDLYSFPVIGPWYVYDTARGMTVLTDPYLLLNSTAAEVATLGSVTTVSTGFALDSTILADINISAGSYIFLAIA